jgi:hypothetical protein
VSATTGVASPASIESTALADLLHLPHLTFNIGENTQPTIACPMMEMSLLGLEVYG